MTKQEKRVGPILAIVIAWFFYLYSYVARIEPTVLVDDLMSDFSMTATVIGFVISIMYIPYVLLQVPCGLIVDKIGVRMVIFASALLCSLGTFIFANATSVFHLELARFVIGASSAAAFLCCGKVATEFFDKSKYPMLMGIAMAMGCFGGVAGTTPTAFLVAKMGWRGATVVIAIVGLILAVAALFLVPKGEKSNKTNSPKANIFDGLKILARNPMFWLIGLYGMISYLPLSALAELWAIPFVQATYENISKETASIAGTVTLIGFGLGGVVSAWVAKMINSFKKTIIMCSLGMLVSFSAVFFIHMPFSLMVVLFFLGGMFAGANTLCFSLALDLVPIQFGGTSTGFMNTLVMCSGLIFQPLLGKLLDVFRNGMVNNAGEPMYNLDMYKSAFLVIVICMVLAFVVTLFIKESRDKPQSY